MKKAILFIPGETHQIVSYSEDVIQSICPDGKDFDIMQITQQYILISNPNAQERNLPLNFITKHGLEVYGPAFVGKVVANEVVGLEDAEAFSLYIHLVKEGFPE